MATDSAKVLQAQKPMPRLDICIDSLAKWVSNLECRIDDLRALLCVERGETACDGTMPPSALVCDNLDWLAGRIGEANANLTDLRDRLDEILGEYKLL